jgi:hypothetical protein
MANVNFLLLELSLAPCLILVSSLAQQRWGQRVSGLIVGLPLTSLPLLMLLSLAHGARFSASAADSSLEASVAQALLIWVYVAVARRSGALWSLAASAGAFGLGVAVLYLTPTWPPLLSLSVGIASYLVALRWWPEPVGRASATRIRVSQLTVSADGGKAVDTASSTGQTHGLRLRYRLAIRMVIAALFAAILTGASGILGSQLSGLVSAFPVLTFVMGGLTHSEAGEAEVADFLHGVTRGSFAVVTSLFCLAVTLPSGHLVEAFALASLTAVATQWVTSISRGSGVANGGMVEA